MERLRLAVKWRGCAGCVEDAQTVLKNTAGIMEARASFAEGTLEVAFDPAIITPREVIEKVASLGFGARVAE